MSNVNKVNQNIMWFLASSAAKHEMPLDAASKPSKPLFEYYDSNKDNVLQKEELEKIKQDLQSLISNDDKKCTQKDIQKYLESIANDNSISIKKLNGFIIDILANYETNILHESDGEIELFQQGEKGDCWLLSQISSLSQTDWGKEAIKNSIKKDKDTNSYTIKFTGANFETTITQQDIQQARKYDKYSYGDRDMLLFELAAEKYFTHEIEQGHIPSRDYIQNGNLSAGTLSMQYLLTGKTGHSFFLIETSEEEHQQFTKQLCNLDPDYKTILKNNQQYISNTYDKETMTELINKISLQEDIAIICGFLDQYAQNDGQLHNKKDLSKFNAHGCAIKSMTKDAEGNITDIEIINPWDSETPIHKTLQEFLDEIDEIAIINKDDKYDDLKTGFKPCIDVE